MLTTRFRSLHGLAALAFVLAVYVACGPDDRKVVELVRCEAECSGRTPVCENGVCVECASDSTPRCIENETPQQCVNNKWVSEPACSGNRPVCARGECASARLVGGLLSVGASSESGSIRLVDHGFEEPPRTCGTLNDESICVIGGIRP